MVHGVSHGRGKRNKKRAPRGERSNPCGDSTSQPRCGSRRKNGIAPLPLVVISFAPGGARAGWGVRFSHGVRSCEKINNLTQRRRGAKARKEQLLCSLCALCDFAPLREMLWLFPGSFHGFLRRGLRSSARFAGRPEKPRTFKTGPRYEYLTTPWPLRFLESDGLHRSPQIGPPESVGELARAESPGQAFLPVGNLGTIL